MNDVPQTFNAKIYRKGINNENTINKSKAVGEPPLLLAFSTYFAIKNAISYNKKNNNKVDLTAPATPENILISINK